MIVKYIIDNYKIPLHLVNARVKQTLKKYSADGTLVRLGNGDGANGSFKLAKPEAESNPIKIGNLLGDPSRGCHQANFLVPGIHLKKRLWKISTKHTGMTGVPSRIVRPASGLDLLPFM